MDPLYRRTFDQVCMDREGAGRVRSELASRCAQRKLEVTDMKTNSTKTRRPLAAIVAVCAVLALSVTAFASSGIAERVFHMLSGATLSVGMDESGNVYVDQAINEEDIVSPVEKRDNGRLYFVANGEEIDITDQCSYETPFIKDCTDASGQRHIFIIGGDPDAIGWAECMMDGDDSTTLSAFVLNLAPEAENQPTPWLDAALEQMNQMMELEIVE